MCALYKYVFILFFYLCFEWLKVSNKFQDSQFSENEPFKLNSKITKQKNCMCTVNSYLETIVFPSKRNKILQKFQQI